MTRSEAKPIPALLRLHSCIPAGFRHMAAAAFFFSLMSLLVKLAGARLPSSQLVLVRALICLTWTWIWLRRAGVSPWGAHPGALLLRGFFGTGALVCFYYTLVTLPMAEAVVIQQACPIFTAALAALVLGERVSRRLVLAMVCCAGGLIAIARPGALFGGAASALDPVGVAAAFGSALSSACAYVLIRSFRERENPLVMVFYFPLVTVPVILPFAVAGWLWPRPLEWLMLLALGVVTQLAQVQMTRGLMLVPVGRATAVSYIQVVLAVLWGAIFFAEVPDLLTLAGAVLILGATFSLALAGSEKRSRGEDGIVQH